MTLHPNDRQNPVFHRCPSIPESEESAKSAKSAASDFADSAADF